MAVTNPHTRTLIQTQSLIEQMISSYLEEKNLWLSNQRVTMLDRSNKLVNGDDTVNSINDVIITVRENGNSKTIAVRMVFISSCNNQ